MQAMTHQILAVALLALLPMLPSNGAPVSTVASPPPMHPELGASVDIGSKQMNPPRYPSEEARAGITGTTVMVIHVDATGAVGEVLVEKSSGNANLDKAATDAARTWRFHPGQQQGKNVAGRVRVPVDFNMGPPPVLDMSLPLPAWDATHPLLTGAEVCDLHINKVLACAKGKAPNETFELLLRHADLMRTSLAGLTPQQKQEVSKQCASEAEAYAANQIAMGCAP